MGPARSLFLGDPQANIHPALILKGNPHILQSYEGIRRVVRLLYLLIDENPHLLACHQTGSQLLNIIKALHEIKSLLQLLKDNLVAFEVVLSVEDGVVHELGDLNISKREHTLLCSFILSIYQTNGDLFFVEVLLNFLFVVLKPRVALLVLLRLDI